MRAVINLSEVLDLSGRTDEALAVVRATLPLVHADGEPSSYDTFLETQQAYELLRLGRTAEAAAALPARVPGDAIGSTPMFVIAVRAQIAMVRGDDRRRPPLARQVPPPAPRVARPAVVRGARGDDGRCWRPARTGSRTRVRPRRRGIAAAEPTDEACAADQADLGRR